jgi:hypothetical protein
MNEETRMDKLKPRLSRRTVFAAGGTAGALAAAAVALPLAQKAQPQAAAAKPEIDKDGGYQLTQHVLRYYETTKV